MHHESVVVDFLRAWPGVELDIDLTHRIVDLVEERIDVAIRLTRPTDSSLIARRLAPAPLVVVAAPSLDRSHVHHPADLAGVPAILDSNFRFHPRWPFRVDGERFSVEMSGPVTVNSPLLVRQLVRSGLGVGLVPHMIVADDLADGSLVELVPGTVDAGWSVFAVTSARRQLSARTRAFLTHLAERVR
ncbi:MAG: substrate binding domain-containing protein [Myxococcota bacterium]